MYFQPFVDSDSIARQDASTAQRDARDAQADVRVLTQEVERLLMISEGLWELLKQKTDLADEDLHKKIRPGGPGCYHPGLPQTRTCPH